MNVWGSEIHLCSFTFFPLLINVRKTVSQYPCHICAIHQLKQYLAMTTEVQQTSMRAIWREFPFPSCIAFLIKSTVNCPVIPKL